MQCVLSRKIGIPQRMSSFDAYEKVRLANPSPYCFHIDFGDEQLFGASPEMHLKVERKGKETTAEIRPLAGTIRRGKTALEDFYKRLALLNDAKEVSEHAMLVDLARNDLNIFAKPASVQVKDFAQIEEYPNLYHLGSSVIGNIASASPLEVLLATLPAGTLSGAPKIEAMRAIEELEGSRRGFYGGAVGFINKQGCNTGITIRSAHAKNGRFYIRSGAGIVKNSIPEKEAKETLLKAEKMMQVLGGAQ